ncbi:AbiV family abortive infection protein [Taibaiella helva]|uniref:AbiV family abortive infection protein n=1 Tax=Taibaiella helva TaxID=2301235 RepID=UPI000E576BE3|nr:AbiV family abortive infection protein [Taibaiella helva]
MTSKSTIRLENIDLEELKRGCKITIENAEEMIEEADILINNKRFARAYTLYQLGIEEVGKSNLLLQLIFDLKIGRKVDAKALNKEFKFHQAKSKSSIVFEKAALLLMLSTSQEGSAQERVKQFFEESEKVDKENANMLNDNKNKSLYVGIENGKFISPKYIITTEMALNLRTKALIRTKAAKGLLEGFLNDIDTLTSAMKNLEDQGKQVDSDMVKGFFKD